MIACVNENTLIIAIYLKTADDILNNIVFQTENFSLDFLHWHYSYYGNGQSGCVKINKMNFIDCASSMICPISLFKSCSFVLSFSFSRNFSLFPFHFTFLAKIQTSLFTCSVRTNFILYGFFSVKNPLWWQNKTSTYNTHTYPQIN